MMLKASGIQAGRECIFNQFSFKFIRFSINRTREYGEL